MVPLNTTLTTTSYVTEDGSHDHATAVATGPASGITVRPLHSLLADVATDPALQSQAAAAVTSKVGAIQSSIVSAKDSLTSKAAQAASSAVASGHAHGAANGLELSVFTVVLGFFAALMI